MVRVVILCVLRFYAWFSLYLAGNYGKGKDMSNITNMEEEEKDEGNKKKKRKKKKKFSALDSDDEAQDDGGDDDDTDEFKM